MSRNALLKRCKRLKIYGQNSFYRIVYVLQIIITIIIIILGHLT